MGSGEYVPKLTIDITEKQYRRLQNLLPHGFKKIIFGILIDDLCDLLESNSQERERILGAFMQRAVDIRVLGTLKNAKD